MDTRMKYRTQIVGGGGGGGGGGAIMMLNNNNNNNHNLLRSVGSPIYTLCGSNPKTVINGGGGGGGAQLLMNATNVNASTQFSFIPARPFVTTTASIHHHPFAASHRDDHQIASTGASSPFQPLLNTIRGFFTSFLRPKVTEFMDSYATNSRMSDDEDAKSERPPPPPPSATTKTTDFDIDFDRFDAMELSASTKSFSDNDLRKCTQTIGVSDDDDDDDDDDEFADAIDMNESLLITAEKSDKQTKDSTPTKTTITKPIHLRSPPPCSIGGGRRRHNKKNLHRSKHGIQQQQQIEKSSTPPPHHRGVHFQLASSASSKNHHHHHHQHKVGAAKNRKESSRHQLARDIHDDIRLDDDRTAAEMADEDTVDFVRLPVPLLTSASLPSSLSVTTIPFGANDFPAIGRKAAAAAASPTTTKHRARKPRKTATPPPSPQPEEVATVVAVASSSTSSSEVEPKSNCSWEIPYRTTVSALSVQRFNCAKQRAADRRAAVAETCRRRNNKQIECDSEDNGSIEFVNEVAGGGGDLVSTQSICERIRNHFDGIGGGGSRRVRQMSECSDDFICFERDDNDEDEEDDDDDDDEEEEDDEESEEDDSDDDDDEEEEEDVVGGGLSESDDDLDDVDDVEECSGGMQETGQLDSGFEEKKQLKVHFNLVPKVHVMRAWSFAYRQTRKGYWEQIGRDRVRFSDRIQRSSDTLGAILDAKHRQQIYEQRFNDDHHHHHSPVKVGSEPKTATVHH